MRGKIRGESLPCVEPLSRDAENSLDMSTEFWGSGLDRDYKFGSYFYTHDVYNDTAGVIKGAGVRRRERGPRT